MCREAVVDSWGATCLGIPWIYNLLSLDFTNYKISDLLSSSWTLYPPLRKKEIWESRRGNESAFNLVLHYMNLFSLSLSFSVILFSILNEISFTIISLSSSDKFFLESWFFISNYYYITNYHRNLLRFTLYIRS